MSSWRSDWTEIPGISKSSLYKENNSSKERNIYNKIVHSLVVQVHHQLLAHQLVHHRPRLQNEMYLEWNFSYIIPYSFSLKSSWSWFSCRSLSI